MEMYPQNLTIFEGYLLKAGFGNLYITKVTAVERAAFEAKTT